MSIDINALLSRCQIENKEKVNLWRSEVTDTHSFSSTFPRSDCYSITSVIEHMLVGYSQIEIHYFFIQL